ncbi:MAG: hypothetical protein AAB441_00070 [Patescibacteria group bacterium]
MEKEIKTVNLQIAGFLIKVVFDKCEWRYAKNKFSNDFTEFYKNFISKSPKKANFSCFIHIIQKKELLLNIEKNVGFIEMFKETNIRKYYFYYQFGIFQFQFLLNKIITNLLVQKHGFNLHASSCVINDRATLFLGSSGAGKSTIILLLKNNFQPFADDAVYIGFKNKKYYVFQTPLLEKEINANQSTKSILLGDVYFIKQSHITRRIKLTDKRKIIELVANQSLLDSNKKELRDKIIGNIMKYVSSQTNFYTLYFTKNTPDILKEIET